jgi:hypothetical protein
LVTLYPFFEVLMIDCQIAAKGPVQRVPLACAVVPPSHVHWHVADAVNEIDDVAYPVIPALVEMLFPMVAPEPMTLSLKEPLPDENNPWTRRYERFVLPPYINGESSRSLIEFLNALSLP